MNTDDKLFHEMPEVVPLATTFTPPNLILASLAFAIIVVALLAFFNRRKGPSKANTVLLVGTPDGGKTSLLSKLLYGQTLPTQTSMQINTGVTALPPNKSIRIVDIPGHPRLRSQFQDFLPETKAVVFVVDASTVSRNAAEVAEHLHHILHALASLPPSQVQPSLLIIAHKSDLLKTSTSSQTPSGVLAINRIKTILERELEKRRVSQTGGVNVEGLGEEGEGTEMGGLMCGEKEGSAFKFDEWEGGEVSFLATSIASKGDEKAGGVDSLWEWLRDTM